MQVTVSEYIASSNNMCQNYLCDGVKLKYSNSSLFTDLLLTYKPQLTVK
jgi:hypothetical protein